MPSSPFGGIPRNWKLNIRGELASHGVARMVPPSGGSLEIGNNPKRKLLVKVYLSNIFMFPLRGDP